MRRKQPTAAQLKWMRRADARGVIEPPRGHGGLAKANWERLMQRLVPVYVIPYAHGGYELTVVGKILARDKNVT